MFKNVEYGYDGAQYEDLSYTRHPLEGRYIVRLNGKQYGDVFKTRNGDWGALPYVYKRGRPLSGFANRYYATVYCLWAGGVIPEDHMP